MEAFRDGLHQPYTIFTLVDKPHNDGSGSSNTSLAKLGSLFLQTFALAMIDKEGEDRSNWFQAFFFQLYELIQRAKNDTKSGSILHGAHTMTTSCDHPEWKHLSKCLTHLYILQR